MRVFGVTGWKNAGKTGLMERLVAEFTRRGVTVSTIKHAHHTTDVDQPGRDSYRHRSAGAREVLLSSPHRWAQMHELRADAEPGLDALLARLSPVDLVLIEGFKNAPHPKIEAWRAEVGKPPLATRNKTIRAVASDGPVTGVTCPALDLNRADVVADFIAAQVGLPDRDGVPDAKAFDTVVVVDWSAASTPTSREPRADALWMGVAKGRAVTCHYHRTRHALMAALKDLLSAERAAGCRCLVGFDFPFAYPSGFAAKIVGNNDPLALWRDLAQRISDSPANANNRFEVARDLNGRFPGIGPFWGCPSGQDTVELPAKGTLRQGHGLAERRAVERAVPGTQPCWKLYTTGSVGSQVLTGLPHLQSLRDDPELGPEVRVAPFEALDDGAIVLAEVFPSLISETVAAMRGVGEIRDCAQVRVLARALWAMSPPKLMDWLGGGDPVEGGILGAGHAEELAKAAQRGYRA